MTVVFYKYRRSVRAQLHHNRTILKVQQPFHSVVAARRYINPLINPQKA